MDLSTPKYDQVKKRYLKKLLKEPDNHALFEKGGANGEASSQTATTAELSNSTRTTSLKESVEDAQRRQADAAKIRGKIADLLRRSVESTRLAEPVTQPAEVEATECSIAKEFLSRSLDELYMRLAREHLYGAKKVTDFAKVNRNIQLSYSTGDLYEIIGWFQEKVKALWQDEYYAESGRRAEGALSQTHAVDENQPDLPALHTWEDYLLFLDGLKAYMKKISRKNGQASGLSEKGKADMNGGGEMAMLNALHEIGLVLMTDKVREKSEYIARVHVTVQEQTEVLELMEERLVELREKVREYGRENAELEATQEELKESLSEAHSARYEAAERAALLQRTCEQLQRENAAQREELTQMRRAAQSSTAASAASVRNRSEGGNRIMSRLQAFEQRLGQHARGVLSDLDSGEDYRESERKSKSAQSGTARSPTTTTFKSASRTADEVHHHLSQLDSYGASFWIAQYNSRNGTIEDMNAAEAEMGRVEAQLESALATFRTAQREVALTFRARAAQLRQLDKERTDRERAQQALQTAENALCCICKEEPKSILLMPCRHLCVCQVCSQGPPSPTARSPRNNSLRCANSSNMALKNCPVCRAKVDECLKVYA